MEKVMFIEIRILYVSFFVFLEKWEYLILLFICWMCIKCLFDCVVEKFNLKKIN